MSLSEAYDLVEKTESLLNKKNKDLAKIRENYLEIIAIFKLNLSKNLENKEIRNGLNLVINEYSNKLQLTEEIMNNDTSYSVNLPNVSDLNTKRGIQSHDPLLKFQTNISTLLSSSNITPKDRELILSQINILKKDLTLKEFDVKNQYELKLKSLMLENKSLKNEISKLNKRWNELVESAKKRRNSVNSS